MGLIKLFISAIVVAALCGGAKIPLEWSVLFCVVLLAGWISHGEGGGNG